MKLLRRKPMLSRFRVNAELPKDGTFAFMRVEG